MKKYVPINSGWLYAVGFDRSCLEEGYDFSDFRPVSLPHCARNGTEVTTATYTRIVELGQEYDRSRLKLCFDGALSYVEVYVNGIFVTSHKGDTPFKADVSAPLRVGYENRIVLKVDSRNALDIPLTFGVSPVPTACGLHRGVGLEVVSGGEIADAFVKTQPVGEDADVEIDITLGEFYPDSRIYAEIYDGSGNRVGALPEKTVLGMEVTLSGSISGIKPWSPDSPVMYTAVMTLRNNRRIMDVKQTAFGFRKAEFTRDGFMLNGEKLRLIGLNRIDDYPVLGRAATDSLQRFDARKLKELGCNAVRTHGLPAIGFVDECDRLGLLVIEDIGGDGYIGDSAWKELFVGEIEDVVRRDRSHPSVIAWGVRVRGSADCDELYFKTTKAVHECDPTRPALGTRDFMGSRLYEDVFAYADYSESGKVSRRSKTGRLSVPYFVSEHTGKALPTRRYDTAERRNEQALRHIRFMDAVGSVESLSGCAGMAFADFACFKRLGGDGVMYYGVTDAYRIDKTAAAAYRSQTEEKPYLELSSDLSASGDSTPLVIYTNCECVRIKRDGCIVGEFYPDRKKYASLKHPPIEISDLIGRAPEEGDKLSQKQNALLKFVARAAKKRGTVHGLPFTARIAAFVLSRLLGLNKELTRALIEKYTFEPAVYEVEGISGGETVIMHTCGAAEHKTSLRLSCSDTVVHPSDTYETVLVTVECVDEEGRVQTGEFAPVEINVEGAMLLVGASVLTLVGGATGFYLTTTPYDGRARVSVRSRFGSASLDLEVIHERVEEL